MIKFQELIEKIDDIILNFNAKKKMDASDFVGKIVVWNFDAFTYLFRMTPRQVELFKDVDGAIIREATIEEKAFWFNNTSADVIELPDNGEDLFGFKILKSQFNKIIKTGQYDFINFEP